MPTETIFWIEKPISRFELKAEALGAQPGMDTLHRKLILTYRFDDQRLERLDIPFELFALLMDLKEGVQLSDVASDAAFANLAVFIERLGREDDTRVFAWNPLQENVVFEVAIHRESGGQLVVLAPMDTA